MVLMRAALPLPKALLLNTNKRKINLVSCMEFCSFSIYTFNQFSNYAKD
jgi:hypothetical protein